MLRFALRRLLAMVPMVLVVVSLTWGLIRLAPGNFYTGERRLPPAIERNLREKYGLDRPWYVQYGRMLANTVRGDFGSSLKYHGRDRSITILRRRGAGSATLGLLAYLLALVVGITAGTLAALRQNSRSTTRRWRSRCVGISMPNFVLGPMLVLLFALTLVLAAAGAVGGLERQPDPAGADAVGGLHGLHRAADAGRHARGAALELHPHGARERTARAHGARCATRCAAGCCRSCRSPARRWRFS